LAARGRDRGDGRLVPRARGREARQARRAPAVAVPRRRPGGQTGRRSATKDHVMATLYRCQTPTDWLCPCGRVARALRRDGIDYDEVRVPYAKRDRSEVHALTGQAHVPVVVLD